MRQLDVLFVHPGAARIIYQGLSDRFSAIETPTWSLLLAQSCRRAGFGVAILDCDAERLDNAKALLRIREANPRLVCFVVYGQNPNAGTTKMTGAVSLAAAVKDAFPEYPICFVGSHVSALPREVLASPSTDFVLLNEGVYALRNLLASDLRTDLQNVKGIGWKNDGQERLNEPEKVVSQDFMETDLPGYAWDLLPYQKRPLDLYRSCNWHVNFRDELRQPYAALYTSLGCRFRCNFCMINILNRTDNAEGVHAAHSASMRYWSPEFVLREFDRLYEMGVRTIRLSDEMFFFDKRHFEPVLRKIVERGYGKDLILWAYARVDTVREAYLDLFRAAGVNFLALGIESADRQIRRDTTKGSFGDTDIRKVVDQIRSAGVNVMANYMYGFPDDTHETMTRTFDLACEMNTEMVSMYPCFALPGSPLYQTAKQNGWELPSSYEAWSFHSYECQPLPTQHISAAEVLRFRDQAWHAYFSNSNYLSMIQSKFGPEARQHIEAMTRIRLKRRLLGD